MPQERLVRTHSRPGAPLIGATLGVLGLLIALLVLGVLEDWFGVEGGVESFLLVLLVAAFAAIHEAVTRTVAASNDKSVLILGEDQLAGQLKRDLEVAASSLNPDLRRPSREEEKAKSLRELIDCGHVSDVVVTDPSISTHAEITELLIECKFRGVRISRAPEFYESVHKKVWLEALRPEAFVYSEVVNLSPSYRALKRSMDLVSAVVVTALTLPLMLLIAAAIKLESRGPVLFRQERIGRFGVPFTLYKFRSMRGDAERDTGPVWAREDDERITRVGRILRRTHLDELPQVINVLLNDLSFVGPRPEREVFIRELEQEIPYFRLRQYIKPGITGWAQVRSSYGDSVESSAEKLRYDLYYAKHASLGFDLKILAETVWHVTTGRGR